MVDPFARDPEPTTSPGTERARSDLDERFRHVGADAEGGSKADATGFKAEARQAAHDAKSAAASIAEQARARIAEIVDEQKAAGAARVSGVAKAARSAAGDLDSTNPELARLVRSAADGVDRVASDIRSRDIGDVIDTVARFGRRQPVAFFGGAVLTGFLLARFFKSDAPLMGDGLSRPL